MKSYEKKKQQQHFVVHITKIFLHVVRGILSFWVSSTKEYFLDLFLKRDVLLCFTRIRLQGICKRAIYIHDFFYVAADLIYLEKTLIDGVFIFLTLLTKPVPSYVIKALGTRVTIDCKIVLLRLEPMLTLSAAHLWDTILDTTNQRLLKTALYCAFETL